MWTRILPIAAVLGAAAFAVWHPVSRPALQSVTEASTAPFAPSARPDGGRHHRRRAGPADAGQLVVYVAGAVRRPGLYRLDPGARDEDAVVRAGGLSASADAAGVDLAAHVADGDEIDVPAIGESVRSRSSARTARRRPAPPPPSQSVDVNAAGAAELAAVPGIGRAIAQRIVEMRARDGRFGSLDELLDVAGMTQARLERAMPYLQAL